MPKLTVKSYAEMMHLPAYSQMRILTEQKYPDDDLNIWRMPFYKHSLDTIKLYHLNSNDTKILSAGIHDCINLAPKPKKDNNKRVLQDYRNSPHASRNLGFISKKKTYKAHPKQNIELKLTFDLEAIENKKPKRIFFNFRNIAIDPDIAKDTIQIAHWVLCKTDPSSNIKDIEFIDLCEGIVYKANTVSTKSLSRFMSNAKVVEALWATI